MGPCLCYEKWKSNTPWVKRVLSRSHRIPITLNSQYWHVCTGNTSQCWICMLHVLVFLEYCRLTLKDTRVIHVHGWTVFLNTYFFLAETLVLAGGAIIPVPAVSASTRIFTSTRLNRVQEHSSPVDVYRDPGRNSAYASTPVAKAEQAMTLWETRHFCGYTIITRQYSIVIDQAMPACYRVYVSTAEMSSFPNPLYVRRAELYYTTTLKAPLIHQRYNTCLVNVLALFLRITFQPLGPIKELSAHPTRIRNLPIE